MIETHTIHDPFENKTVEISSKKHAWPYLIIFSLVGIISWAMVMSP